MSTGNLCAHFFCTFEAVHCFVLAAKITSQKWRLTGNNYVHSYISGTQGVNTTPFCTCTQALVPGHKRVDSPIEAG